MTYLHHFASRQPVKDILGINQCRFEFKARGKHTENIKYYSIRATNFLRWRVFISKITIAKVDLRWTENHAKCT